MVGLLFVFSAGIGRATRRLHESDAPRDVAIVYPSSVASMARLPGEAGTQRDDRRRRHADFHRDDRAR